MLEKILNIPDVASFISKTVEYQPQLLAHSVYTAAYAEGIGRVLELTEEEMHTLVIGAVLHDYGKLKIPIGILDKPAKLDDTEWDFMKAHPLLGLVDAPAWLSPAMQDIIRHHHEKMDGSGYPDGLTDISPLTRIVTVADMFEAITTNRSYKKEMTKKDAICILHEDASSGKIDRNIVKALERSLANPISPLPQYLAFFMQQENPSK